MPPELEDALIDEVRGLRGDVRNLSETVADERRGRKSTSRLAIVVLALSLFGGGFLAANWVRSGQISCGTRNDSRADSRAMTVTVADNTVTKVGELTGHPPTAAQRAVIRESNEAIALREYPPLAC